MSNEALNTSLSIFGVLVSAAGTGLTLWQISKTKSAIDISQQATSKAVKKLALSISSNELYATRGSIKIVQESLRSKRLEAASMHIQTIIEQLSALRERPGFDSAKDQTNIQAVIVNLSKIRNKIEEQIATPTPIILDISKINITLYDLSSNFTAWSERIQYSEKGE